MTIPYHIPHIPKPQQQYNFNVNNYEPFVHLLPNSQDGSRMVHPAETFDHLDFVDRRTSVDPVKPLPLESTPFKLIEDVAGLGYLAAKLEKVDEFAVDVEHNAYRSFQGISCLIQISTRTEDFVVDALKLRSHIGEYLRGIFRDPSIRKVIHGSDNDVMWLQRDFGIYIVNLFDTMRGSQVLKLERNSFEYLLKYYCGVVANKEYQASDWRIRPMPTEMVKYAREDTHYLLYIYDMMRNQLVSEAAKSLSGYDDPLGEAYKRSYEISVKLYEVEEFDNKATQYLSLYGLSEANLEADQLSIVAALCQWRDTVARDYDESTGFVLPNKMVVEIAKAKPLEKEVLLKLVGYNKSYVIKDAEEILEFIKRADNEAWKFRDVALLVKHNVAPSEIKEKIQTSRLLHHTPHRFAHARVDAESVEETQNLQKAQTSHPYHHAPYRFAPARVAAYGHVVPRACTMAYRVISPYPCAYAPAPFVRFGPPAYLHAAQ